MFPLHALTAVSPISQAGSLSRRSADNAPFLNALIPGQRLRATVQAGLSPEKSEFVVSFDAFDVRRGMRETDIKRVEKQLLHMKLPVSVQPGDVLDLIFVSRDPAPAFMLAANASGKDRVPLSITGRFISDLLGRPAPQADPGVLAGTVPLLPGPPGDSARLALSLAAVLSRSGLFYESHQAQWLSGARTLEELALEPQARLSQLPRLQPQTAPLSAMLLRGGRETGLDGGGHADEHAMHQPVHPEAQGLVRQQLEILEMRQVTWQGVAWPGQPMEWEVAEEKGHPPADSDQSAAWKTCLKLMLPNLGPVCVSFLLDTRGMEVQVTTSDPVTAFMLRSGAPPLVDGLESAGICLLGMKVHLDGHGIDKS